MLLKMCSFHEGEVTFPMYLGNAYSFATITGFVVYLKRSLNQSKARKLTLQEGLLVQVLESGKTNFLGHFFPFLERPRSPGCRK